MRFEFATAGSLLFGPGTLGELATVTGKLGKCPLVVCGSNSARAQPVVSAMQAADLKFCCFETRGEPTTEQIKSGVNLARESGCDVVIGFGGGSVIDSGKAIAGLATNADDILEYLEVIGKEDRSLCPLCPASRFRPLQAPEPR